MCVCVCVRVCQVQELSARSFEAFAECMACRWSQYLLAHVALASGIAPQRAASDQRASSDAQDSGGAIRLHLMVYERLAQAESFASELAAALAFLGLPPPSPERLACLPSLAKHPVTPPIQHPIPLMSVNFSLPLHNLTCSH